MHSRLSKFACLAFAVACATIMPWKVVAQDTAKPAAKDPPSESPSKYDIFAGYSYLSPHGHLTPNTNAQSVNYGVIGSVARYFDNYVGIQFEGDWHNDKNEDSTTKANNDFSGGSGGIIFRFPTEDITPFVHALVGGESVGSTFYNNEWGVVVTAGGGVDYNTPLFDHRLAIRVFQADYQYVHVNFYPIQRANFNIARLSTGLVFKVGTIAPPPPVTLACSANPTAVFPGEPVTVTGTAGSVNPKEHVVYTWTGQGVTGTDETAKVDTTNLAPGSYTVNGAIKTGKPGKEGQKPWQNASCSATFTVKEYEPPTITCSANPSTIKPGDTSTVTAQGVSPQNRPLTYSYTASGGTISGTGTTATYSSTGAPTGPAQITCNVADDKGHTASANTTVTIEAPPPPPQPHAQALCSINFTNDPKRPTRVDNEAKACLDEVALALQQQTDAKAVVVGSSNAAEKAPPKKGKKAKVTDFAAQRAVNTKNYLVTEKGIDASRISVATNQTDAQQVQDYLVPAGADFNTDVQGTTPVDESTVQPEVRKALPERHPSKSAKQSQ